MLLYMRHQRRYFAFQSQYFACHLCYIAFRRRYYAFPMRLLNFSIRVFWPVKRSISHSIRFFFFDFKFVFMLIAFQEHFGPLCVICHSNPLFYILKTF